MSEKPINHALEAVHEGLTFNEYHEREMSRMAAMLVAGAGGKIVVSRKVLETLPDMQLMQTVDHATGDMIFVADKDVQAFNDSFGEQK